LSNRTPELNIQWDGARLGITGTEIGRILLTTEPRIVLARATGTRPGSMNSTVSVVPYQMSPGDEKVVADRLYALLSSPPKIDNPPAPPSAPPPSVAGQWDVHLEFDYGAADHTVILEQNGGRLVGTHHGEFAAGDLTGTVDAAGISFQSSLPTEGTRVSFAFTGKLEGEKMSGVVSLGEYGEARFTAGRHPYRGNRRG
jgi:L-seryl-tRNA(Ser) seleniumtransferase